MPRTTEPCDVENCDRPQRGRGLCGTHYAYARRHGTLPQKVERSCQIPGCARPHEGRNLCAFHYQRWYQRGTTDPPEPRLTGEQRFWQWTEVTADCWLWKGPVTNDGYGYFWQGEGKSRAHRFAYELLVGPIPDGLTLDHLCDTPPCVNPAHLRPTTFRENNARSQSPSGRNARKTHCKHGHPLSGDNVYVPPKRPNARYCRECQRLR